MSRRIGLSRCSPRRGAATGGRTSPRRGGPHIGVLRRGADHPSEQGRALRRRFVVAGVARQAGKSTRQMLGGRSSARRALKGTLGSAAVRSALRRRSVWVRSAALGVTPSVNRMNAAFVECGHSARGGVGVRNVRIGELFTGPAKARFPFPLTNLPAHPHIRASHLCLRPPPFSFALNRCFEGACAVAALARIRPRSGRPAEVAIACAGPHRQSGHIGLPRHRAGGLCGEDHLACDAVGDRLSGPCYAFRRSTSGVASYRNGDGHRASLRGPSRDRRRNNAMAVGIIVTPAHGGDAGVRGLGTPALWRRSRLPVRHERAGRQVRFGSWEELPLRYAQARR